MYPHKDPAQQHTSQIVLLNFEIEFFPFAKQVDQYTGNKGAGGNGKWNRQTYIPAQGTRGTDTKNGEI
jgi:hypothetical protein